MSDLLSTGVSGLLASQIGLATTGHNIANAGTDGYSRQTVDFVARPAQGGGVYYIGQGVDAASISRSYGQFLNTALQNATTDKSRADTLQQLSAGLNDVLSGSGGLQGSLDSFFGAVGDLSNAATDTGVRETVLGKAQTLVSTFHTLSSRFQQTASDVSQRITQAVDQVNQYSDAIAKLNQQIQVAVGKGGSPNDLLDKRDQLIRKMAGNIGITVVPQDNSTVNIYTGNGQALVNGTATFKIQAVANPYDATRVEVADSNGVIMSNQVSGGQLGALLEFRSTTLEPAQNQLGRAALALGQAFNNQHHQGVDLDGNQGGDFFSLGSPRVLANAGNTGSGTVSASVTGLSNLTASDYMLRYQGGSWSLTTSTGQAVPMTGTGTAADPFVADGVSFTVGGTPANGDSFQIQPTRGAAGDIGLAVDSTRQIAAASLLTASGASSNTGSAAPGAVSVTDPTNAALTSGASIVFTSATTYTVNGGAVQTYTPGQAISANGWSMTLSGTPATGDSFNVAPRGADAGDNGNALSLAGLANTGVLDGGVTTVNGAYSALTAAVGNAGQQAQQQLDTNTSIYNQAMQAQQNVSGVNLDEEAANLVRFQQSYQASAQVIRTASTLFNTLISTIGN